MNHHQIRKSQGKKVAFLTTQDFASPSLVFLQRKQLFRAVFWRVFSNVCGLLLDTAWTLFWIQIKQEIDGRIGRSCSST